MSTVSAAMEQVQHALDRAGGHATRLGRLFAVPFDERGRPSMFAIPGQRQALAQAIRDAADGCEIIGVQHDDVRWTAPVALLHAASTRIWTVTDARTCTTIAELMTRLRVAVVTLRDRARGRDVAVHF